MHSGTIRALHVLSGFLLCTASVPAQTPAPAQPTPPAYTIHVGARIVLTDVTVTDRHGNPVRGLDRSAFQILDDGKPQQIASFAEHTTAENPAPESTPAAGHFSNAYLQHPPPAFNVLLLDITTINIVDQMYLAEQLKKFVAAMQPGGLLAVCTRAGDSVVVLQDFTNDPSLLQVAIAKAIPRLQQPGSWAANDMDTLQQTVGLLGRYPGRKNLLWFNGGSNFGLLPDASQLALFANMRAIYDELESTRIAVYPVDARGLTVTSPPGMTWQHVMMEDTAEATGGHAFYNNNGLNQIAARVLNQGADFYTLTYAPHDAKFDNKWHKVKVVLQSGGEAYDLSYRHGYYNDGSNLETPSGQRTVLRADGSTRRQQADPIKAPLVFSATVLPAASTPPALQPTSATSTTPEPKKNETTYNIHYSVSADDLTPQTIDGEFQYVVGTGVLATNRLGANLARHASTVQFCIDRQKVQNNPEARIGFNQQIKLPKGEQFLYIVFWDPQTGRFGTVEAPLNIPKPRK